ELQLHACLATFNGQDSLVDAGTGSGKTLPITLSLLLNDPENHFISLTISPLKWLQVTQVSTSAGAYNFNKNYRIPTIAINDDTPREDNYWNTHIHNIKTQMPGMSRHIIATVEQLFKTPKGHLPHLAILVCNQHFQKRLKRIHVDEAHFIYLAGLPCHGNTAFRPAWGRLDELKALLPHGIPWQALSATFLPHILKTVEMKILWPGYVSIHVSSNRPNMTYTTHCLVSCVEEARNFWVVDRLEKYRLLEYQVDIY
ncbi:hypothetical protein L208DRAFT_1264260, partial [Tricholoma matsutake]